MDDKVIVSVCMISYNHEQFIEEALHSVLNQEVDFPVEIVLSDDGSTDETQAKIKTIIDCYNGSKMIRFFPQSINLGIMKNFVFALSTCKGKYVAICEGDDFWVDKLKLNKQVKILQENKMLVGSFHKVKTIYEDKPYLSGIFQKDAPDLISTKELIAPSSLMHTSSLLFRRDALVFPPWYEMMLSGDYALSSILSAKGFFQKVPEIMSVYRINHNGVTNSKSYTTQVIDLKIAILEKLNEFHNFNYNDEFLSAIEKLIAQKERKISFFSTVRRKLRLGIILLKIKYFLFRR
jgi:glycosyltransferase involved in cell wall biosynthesis